MMRAAIRTIAATVFTVAVVALPASQASAANSRATIAGSKPAWAQPGNRVGDETGSALLQFRVYLQRDSAGAEAVAHDLSTPGSSRYRQWLTPEQVLAQFGPSAASARAVSDWLSSSGFTVDDTAANRLYVEATGTAAQVQQAFGVQLGKYVVRGRTVRGPDRDLSVPASLASSVLGVIGVDQAQSLLTPSIVSPAQDAGVGAGSPNAFTAPAPVPSAPTPNVVPPPDGFRNARPCSQFWAEKLDTTDPPYGGGFPNPLPYADCGHIPAQLRAVYGLDPALAYGITGQGVTVAIIDAFASPNLFKDARQYAARNDPDRPLHANQFSELIFPTNPQLEPPDQCDAAGWYGEQTLDVEAVHAMAPGANILYVGASDCLDISLDKALNRVVSKHLAQIASNSYGDLGEDIAPSEVNAFHQIAINAVLEGIGVYFSSGDSGDEVAGLGFPSADFPASDPLLTAVGGTSLGVNADGSRAIETGWETGRSILGAQGYDPPAPGAFLYGSGGGTSRLYAEPWYQQGVVPNPLARQNQQPGQKGRVVPDIATVGDPNTGMLIGITQTFPHFTGYSEYRIGGTSLSCPLFAGMMALADNMAGEAHGFINPSLYLSLAGSNALTDVIHKVGAVARVDNNNRINRADGLTTSVRTFDLLGLAIATTKGYDNVTGLGTPNGLAFIFKV